MQRKGKIQWYPNPGLNNSKGHVPRLAGVRGHGLAFGIPATLMSTNVRLTRIVWIIKIRSSDCKLNQCVYRCALRLRFPNFLSVTCQPVSAFPEGGRLGGHPDELCVPRAIDPEDTIGPQDWRQCCTRTLSRPWRSVLGCCQQLTRTVGDVDGHKPEAERVEGFRGQ